MTETTEASPAAAEQPAPEASTPAAPTAAAAPAVVAPVGAGRGEGKRKRGRPRKYGPDGSLLRPPLKATPISASAPDGAGGARYTPAAAVGAIMKRGGGRPVGFVSRAPVAVTAAAPTPAVVVSAPAPQTTQLGPPLGTYILSFLLVTPQMSSLI
jgi:hypothetical protein